MNAPFHMYTAQGRCALDVVQDAERAILGGTLSALLQSVQAALAAVSAQDFSQHRLAQLKATALIFDLIHHRDIAECLLAQKCTDPVDWAWQKQLRYYRGPADKENAQQQQQGSSAAAQLHVCMVDAAFQYTWEYQGNAPKLVYTPLTDKCYLTLTQGMALGYGGNPYGPAGTGKTESVKALGQVCLHTWHCMASRAVLETHIADDVQIISFILGLLHAPISACMGASCLKIDAAFIREGSLNAPTAPWLPSPGNDGSAHAGHGPAGARVQL